MSTLDSGSFLQNVCEIAKRQSQKLWRRTLGELRKTHATGLSAEEVEFVESSARRICNNADLQDSFLGVSAKDILLLEGTRFFRSFSYENYKNVLLFVVEQEPQVRTLNFSSHFFEVEQREYDYNEKHDKEYPRDGNRHHVQLAFPYMVFIATIIEDYPFLLYAHYAKKPLTSFDDPVFQVNLPNIYDCRVCYGLHKFSVYEDTPAKKVAATINHFWGSEFNVDGSEGYFDFQKNNKRFSSIWEWEKNSLKDPLFVLDVDWRKEVSFRQRLEEFLSKFRREPTNLENFVKHSQLFKIKPEIKSLASEFEVRMNGSLTGICSSLISRRRFPKPVADTFATHLSSGLDFDGSSLNDLTIINGSRVLINGSRVLIKKDSEYYHQAPNIEGTVKSDFDEFVRGDYWARVEFGDRYSNRYRIKDLELV